MSKATYVIDGASFRNRHEFARHFSEVVLSDYMLGAELNLDAFNDVLRGGFGTPDEGFALVWRNAAISRQALGYDETALYYERMMTTCHPANNHPTLPSSPRGLLGAFRVRAFRLRRSACDIYQREQRAVHSFFVWKRSRDFRS
jgi:hypothetical protein